MSYLSIPPMLPNLNNESDEVRTYLQQVNDYLHNIYSKVRYLDLNDTGIIASDSTPAATDGQDGDLWIYVAGASTALYINKNGSWSAYTNP